MNENSVTVISIETKKPVQLWTRPEAVACSSGGENKWFRWLMTMNNLQAVDKMASGPSFQRARLTNSTMVRK
jgi:hypothetical protein